MTSTHGRSQISWRVCLNSIALIAPILILLSPSLQAATVTLDFDAPDFAAGDVLTSVGKVIFLPNAVVFQPTHVTTFTGTQALRGSSTCADGACSNGAYHMDVRFGTPLPIPKGAVLISRAQSVSVRVGADTLSQSCFPEGTTCPLYVRMVGYDDQGNPVADTYDVLLLDSSSLSNPNAAGYNAPIDQELRIDDAAARIASISIYYGKGTFSHDTMTTAYPGEPQIDHLIVVFPDTNTTSATPPAKPTITISAPIDGSQRAYPYQAHLQGSLTVPGGLAAFCYRLDGSTPTQADCNNNALLSGTQTFDIALADADLRPGANVLSVTVYDLWGQFATQRVTLSTLPPPPPKVTIFYPTANSWVTGSTISTVGQVSTVGGLQGFCVVVNPTAAPSSSNCQQNLAAVSSGFNPLSFAVSLPASQFALGPNSIAAFAYDRWGQLGEAVQSVNAPTDFRVVGMEITQGVQSNTIPLNTVGAAPYTGANLRQNVPTIVRVFANTPGAGSYCCAATTLNAFIPDPNDGSKEIQLGSLFSDSAPAALTTGDLSVPPAMRADPNGGYVFTLPLDWTTQNTTLRLQAVLQANYPLQECTTCLSNNTFSVFGIVFGATASFSILPVALTWTDTSGNMHSPAASSTVFAPVLNISPVPTTTAVLPYVATVDISDLLNTTTGECLGVSGCQDAVFGRVAGVRNLLDPYYDYTIGVGPVDVGLEHLVPYFQLPLLIGANPIAVADTSRPLTAVGHEFYHELAFYHASPGCNAGFPWIFWDPDEKGFIHGVGLDRSKNLLDSAGHWTGQYKILDPGAPGNKANYFDLMSYCANTNDSDAWISVDNWNTFGGAFPNGVISNDFTTGTISSASKPAVKAEGGALRALAVVGADGDLDYLRVDPTEPWILATPPNSTYHFVVRDQAGKEQARVPAELIPRRGHGTVGASLTGLIPARNAAIVQVEHAGRVIGQIKRSAHAPTIKLTSTPRIVSRTNSLKLTWDAHDADEDDNNKLEIRIEFATGADRPYRVLFIGPNRGEFTVPGYQLSAAQDAQVRVVARDGFNETTAAATVTVTAAPPLLEILEPSKDASLPASTPIHLRAAAFGDAARPLPPAQIRWSLDAKLVGTGPLIELRSLKPGRHVATVRASDGQLSATESIAFTIRAQEQQKPSRRIASKQYR